MGVPASFEKETLMRRLQILAMAGVVVALVGWDQDTKEADDRALVEAITQAVAAKATPQNVGQLVATRATINTTRQGDQDILDRADFTTDPKAGGGEVALRKARHVVYWVRPVNDDRGNPKVVGIIWDEKGTAELWSGAVLPPR
jgi:hypothetical protein